MIKIFFDTNIVQGQLYAKDYTLHDFSLNRNLEKVIETIKELEIRDITQIILPDIVVREIRQHKIEEFNKHKINFEEECEKFKTIFGDCIKIRKSDLVDMSVYIEKLDKAITEYLDVVKTDVILFKSTKDLDYILNKAISKQPIFKKTKGENKEFTDSGLKDQVIYETILENYKEKDDLLILFSKDKDFDDIPKETPIIRVSEIEALKNTLLNYSPDAKLKYILRILNNSDSIMNIKGYIKENSNDKIDLFNNKLKINNILGNIEIIEDSDTITLDVNCEVDADSKLINIEITYPNYEIVNAILKE